MMPDTESKSDKIRAAAALGMTAMDIAKRVGCSRPYVSAVLSRDRREGRAREVAARKAIDSATAKDGVDGSILATGGKYRALEDYARAHGVTLTVAQQHWHRARVA